MILSLYDTFIGVYIQYVYIIKIKVFSYILYILHYFSIKNTDIFIYFNMQIYIKNIANDKALSIQHLILNRWVDLANNENILRKKKRDYMKDNISFHIENPLDALQTLQNVFPLFLFSRWKEMKSFKGFVVWSGSQPRSLPSSTILNWL